jgi:hypothetical protein
VAKGIAVVLLALSVGLTGLAIYQTSKAHAIHGPGALAVMADNTVWIGMEASLVHVSGAGHELESCPLSALGLTVSPADLLQNPSGDLVVTQRDDPTLYFVAASGCRRLHTIHPQWPADLVRHGGRSINLAFHPDGRIAIATGGGNAVALFAADGTFLARTRPGAYKFTNGLWWRGENLWTTDTNRSVLRVLDGHSLLEKSTASVGCIRGARFLGGAAALAGNPNVQAALAIYYNGMIEGQVITVSPSGKVDAVPAPTIFHPFRLAWQGDQLLASDAASLKILRWSANRERLPDFGDAALRASWDALAARRHALESLYWPLLITAIASFAIAIAIVARTQNQQGIRAAAAGRLELSTLGTPALSAADIGRMTLEVWGLPLLLLLIAFILLQFAAVNPHPIILLRKLIPEDRLLAACCLGLLAYGCLGFGMARAAKRLREPEFEPLANAAAVRMLKKQSRQSLGLADDETVRETFLWQVPMPAWIVLTDRRLLMLGWLSQRIFKSFTVEELKSASSSFENPDGRAAKVSRLQRAFSRGWLSVSLADGHVLNGAMSSASIAQRVAALINDAAADAAQKPAPATPSLGVLNRDPRRSAKRFRDAAASILIPGLGQWLQNRFSLGLVYFVGALAALLFLVIPSTWFFVGPRAEVSAATLLYAYGTQAAIALAAAYDAYAAARESGSR